MHRDGTKVIVCKHLITDRLNKFLRLHVLLFLSKIHLSILKNSRFRTTFSRLSVWDHNFRIRW